MNYKLFNTYTSCWFCSKSDFISSKTCRTLSSWNKKKVHPYQIIWMGGKLKSMYVKLLINLICRRPTSLNILYKKKETGSPRIWSVETRNCSQYSRCINKLKSWRLKLTNPIETKVWKRHQNMIEMIGCISTLCKIWMFKKSWVKL